jgi:hypothetical protein
MKERKKKRSPTNKRRKISNGCLSESSMAIVFQPWQTKRHLERHIVAAQIPDETMRQDREHWLCCQLRLHAPLNKKTVVGGGGPLRLLSLSLSLSLCRLYAELGNKTNGSLVAAQRISIYIYSFEQIPEIAQVHTLCW